MRILDVTEMLADLNSPEAELLDHSVIVTATTAEFLADLYETFVYRN